MMASLTTNLTDRELFPSGGAISARPRPSVARPQPAVAGLRLLPRSLREMLARRAERRALVRSIARLRELSPHLLDDVGLLDWDGTAPAVEPPEPAVAPRQPSEPAGGAFSWLTRTRLGPPIREWDERSSADSMWRPETPAWNVPSYWLR